VYVFVSSASGHAIIKGVMIVVGSAAQG